MTIVVAVVTTDGLVLASDSATTQQLRGNDGSLRTSSIWNSANKIVNLRKPWPIGVMTFGRATFAGSAVAVHCKDLRRHLNGEVVSEEHPALAEDYTMEQVANQVHDYFQVLYESEPGDVLGFMVGGFSAGQICPEVWQVTFTEHTSDVAVLLPPGQAGILHQGMTDAITRLVDGAGQGLEQVMVDMQATPETAIQIAEQVRDALGVPLAWQGMPLGETIDLATFLVDTTIKFVRFAPGDLMVGGPIEVAALTRHEGFKWVQRKHYYTQDLNGEAAQ